MNRKNYNLSSKITGLPPSGIREFFDLVQTMDDVVSLGVGEPDFSTPWHITESAIFKLEKGYTSYTSNKGMPELRKEIAAYLKEENTIDYNPDTEILITVGVSEAMDIVLRALCNPGDRIGVIKPSYVSYTPCVVMADGTPVEIECKPENDFKINLEELEKECKTGLKALIINYPCNPTGVSYTKSELEKIVNIVLKYGVIVLSDEVYDCLTYDFDHTSLMVFPEMKEQLIYLNGFSKEYAMTGWRIGYIAGPADIVGMANKIHQYTILCAPIMGQFAAIEAIKNGREMALAMKKEYKRRRNFTVNSLNKIGLHTRLPEGAFYTYTDISSSGLRSNDFAKTLLNKKKVAVVPGLAFSNQGDNYIRISYASSFESIKEAMFRIEEFINEV